MRQKVRSNIKWSAILESMTDTHVAGFQLEILSKINSISDEESILVELIMKETAARLIKLSERLDST